MLIIGTAARTGKEDTFNQSHRLQVGMCHPHPSDNYEVTNLQILVPQPVFSHLITRFFAPGAGS